MYGEYPQPYNGYAYEGVNNDAASRQHYGDHADPESEDTKYRYEGQGQGGRRQPHGNYGAHWAGSSYRNGWQDYDGPSQSRGGWQDLDAPQRVSGSYYDWDAPQNHQRSYHDLDLDDPMNQQKQ